MSMIETLPRTDGRRRAYKGRRMPEKEFYVFFRMGSANEGRYAVIEASSAPKAWNAAYERYGAAAVYTVTNAAVGAVHALLYDFQKITGKEVK